MANRPPNVSYTLQTVSPGTLFDIAYMQNLCRVISLNFKELQGLKVVWNNPEMYTNPAYRLQTPTDGTDLNAMRTADALVGSFVNNSRVNIQEINSLISTSLTLQNSVKGLFTTNAYVATANKTVNTIIAAEDVNEIVTNLNIISNNFDGVNYFWDSSTDRCVRSCQTACQSGCQVSCQACYSSTCHNQNCGGWS